MIEKRLLGAKRQSSITHTKYATAMLTPENPLLETGHGAKIERGELGTASDVQRGPNKIYGEQHANFQNPKRSSPSPWSQSQAQVKIASETYSAMINTCDTKDDKVIGAVILQHPHQHAIHATTPDLITPPQSACNSSSDPKPAPPPGHGFTPGSLYQANYGDDVKDTDRSSPKTEQHESIVPSPQFNHGEAESASLTPKIISVPSPTIPQASTISRKDAHYRRKQAMREAAGVQRSPTSTRNHPPRCRQKDPERPFTKHQSSPRSTSFTRTPHPLRINVQAASSLQPPQRTYPSAVSRYPTLFPCQPHIPSPLRSPLFAYPPHTLPTHERSSSISESNPNPLIHTSILHSNQEANVAPSSSLAHDIYYPTHTYTAHLAAQQRAYTQLRSPRFPPGHTSSNRMYAAQGTHAPSSSSPARTYPSPHMREFEQTRSQTYPKSSSPGTRLPPPALETSPTRMHAHPPVSRVHGAQTRSQSVTSTPGGMAAHIDPSHSHQSPSLTPTSPPFLSITQTPPQPPSILHPPRYTPASTSLTALHIHHLKLELAHAEARYTSEVLLTRRRVDVLARQAAVWRAEMEAQVGDSARIRDR